MINALLASVALLASTTVAQTYGAEGEGPPGYAIVINSCSYDVYLSNTPSDDGHATTVDQTLSPGGSYSQQYQQLLNNNGWSLKLSKDSGAYSSNILQYEYTYHQGEPIWFDLSEVNGNPWDGNWEITATGSCTPRQAAYRYATDDAYGMQSCPVSSSITVTLCSGESGGASQPPSSPSSPAETSSYAPAPTAAPTSEAPAPAPTTSWANTWGAAGKAVEAPAGDAAADSDGAWDGPAVTVTNLHYATVTQYVTATANAKRHAHHPRHPHHRR